MDKRKQRDEIQHALNSTLSGLRDDPWLAQRVIAQAKGGKKVKKKLSVGLVLALILVLAVATALAAMTLNALYEKVIENEGKEGFIQVWDTQSLLELISWMQDAGIQLDDTQLAALKDDTLSDIQKREAAIAIIKSYYPARDDILTSVDIIAKEKGPIEYWSLEDRAWLSDMLEQYQPEEISRGRNLIPEESDITKEEAEKIFFEALEKEYGQTRDDMDMSTLTFSFGIGHFTIDNTSEDIRHWAVNIQTKDHENTAGAYIRANGELIQIINSGAEPTTWLDEYVADRDLFNARTSAVGFYQWLHKWKPILQEKIENGEINPNEKPYANSDILFWYGITDVVGLPRTDDLTQDEARSIADDAIMGQLGWAPEAISCFIPWVSYRTDDIDRPVYWFVYRWYGNNNADELFIEGKITRKVVVKVDARTGEVIALNADNEVYVEGGRHNSVGM